MAAAAVQQLLLSHMGVGPRATHRHLFSSSALVSLEAKQALLAHACRSQCAGVVQDVLLFLVETLSEPLFLRELRLPQHEFAMKHWSNYLREQQRLHATSYAALQDYPLIAFYRGVGRYTDMTNEILQLLLAQTNVAIAHDWGEEAKRLLKSANQPAWLQTQVDQYIKLQQLVRDTESEDSVVAPAARELATFADQRMFTQGLNWGKRHVQLTPSRILIRKHEPDKAERSVNPFLDKRTECVMLAADMHVACRHHSSSTHAASLDRPYCLELSRSTSSSGVVLLLDMWSERARDEWLAAIQANITRLTMDPVWATFPRPRLDPASTTIDRLLRYILLYPSTESRDRQFNAAFAVDATRSLYVQLCVFGQLQQWDAVAELTRPGKVKRLFSAQPQSSIGFGPFLDVCIANDAPPQVLHTYKALYEKQPQKGWTARRK